MLRALILGAAVISTMMAAQDRAPNRREVTLLARDHQFLPNKIEVTQDDLVKLTIESADHTYSFTIDAYRLSRRIPGGSKTVIEFRADQPGTFDFYSNMTGQEKMRGQLIVRRR